MVSGFTPPSSLLLVSHTQGFLVGQVLQLLWASQQAPEEVTPSFLFSLFFPSFSPFSSLEPSLAEKQWNIEVKGSEGLRKQAVQIFGGEVLQAQKGRSQYKGPGGRGSAWPWRGPVWLGQSVQTGAEVRGAVEADGREPWGPWQRLRFYSE